jgi:hypothetical protein
MKSSRDLEFLGLRQLERIGRGEALEPGCDAMLTWPKPALAARRLAAQANTARGSRLLWLVGVDTRGRRRACDRKGFEKWQSALRPFFDGLVPEMEALIVPAEGGKEIILVGIETTRAPFVVRPVAKGETLEVPWFDRESGNIRSASRFDLVRMFTPLGDLPHFEVLEAELTFFRNVIPRTKATYRWNIGICSSGIASVKTAKAVESSGPKEVRAPPAGRALTPLGARPPGSIFTEAEPLLGKRDVGVVGKMFKEGVGIDRVRYALDLVRRVGPDNPVNFFCAVCRGREARQARTQARPPPEIVPPPDTGPSRRLTPEEIDAIYARREAA